MMPLCPYCNERRIAMTLRHNDASYHMCHLCAISGGFKEVIQDCMNRDELEAMWKRDGSWIEEGRIYR